eukprot:2336621-Heterocapsa_arctica.AAC.1
MPMGTGAAIPSARRGKTAASRRSSRRQDRRSRRMAYASSPAASTSNRSRKSGYTDKARQQRRVLQ